MAAAAGAGAAAAAAAGAATAAAVSAAAVGVGALFAAERVALFSSCLPMFVLSLAWQIK